MIDTTTESILSLTEAASLLPRRRQNKKPDVATLYRWTTAGCRGVILESIQVGGTRCTSREALQRFFAALTAKAQGDPVPAPPTTRAHRRAVREAEAVLDKAGI